jgi:DNA polymerase III sliding clamp (beta) subunit (PCNA family)
MQTFKIQPALLKSCQPMMSNDKTRYYLNGVHLFEKGDGTLVYEATNGHAACRISSNLEQNDDISGVNIIIPAHFVKELSKPSFLKGFGVIGDEYIEATLDGKTITIEMPEGTASSKLIDGTFPDIDRVIPSHKIGINELPNLALNLETLAKIASSAKAFESASAYIAINDNTTPVYFRKDGDRGTWEGLLMQTR